MTALTTAELAICAVLALPALYMLIKHGWPGFLGWLYLFIFCTIRVVGAAMFLHGSSSAITVSNIGLTPLLLASAGILHETTLCRRKNLNAKLEWTKVLQYHAFVSAGLALTAVGIAGLQSTNPSSHDAKLAKIGLAVLTAAWAILMSWCLASFFWITSSPDMPSHRMGTQ